MALRLLKWRYSNSGQPEPSVDLMQRKAVEIVNQAHHIARQRGRNVWAILKEMLEDVKKA